MLDRKGVIDLIILLTLLLSSTLTFTQQPVEGQIQYKWLILPPMPTPRTEVTSAAIGSEVYVIGGFEAGRVTSDKVEIFNVVENSWRTGPPLPTPLHHTVAVSLNGKIYVMGGYLEGWIPVDTVYIYDPISGEWREGPKMPRAKGAFTAQVLDGKIYTVGGATTRIVGGRSISEALNINEYLDPETGIWHTASPMPTPREHLASAQARGKMYVVGGRTLTLETNTNVNEEYDPQTDIWTTRAPMPTKRGGIAGASLGGRIFIFGGEQRTGTFDETEVYNPSTDEWRQIEPMPTARHGLTAITILGRILVIGGGPQPGYTYSDANEALDPPQTEKTDTTTSTIIEVRERYSGVWMWFGAGIAVLVFSSVILYLRKH